MFDAQIYREILRSDDFARHCREPAERWVLDRRAHRPAPPPGRLPRVATA